MQLQVPPVESPQLHQVTLEVPESAPDPDTKVRVDLDYQPEKETRDFLRADEEVERLFHSLLDKHRSLSHLIGVQICFLFCKKGRSRNGRQILGSAKVFPAKERLIHQYEFLITLDHVFWRENPDQREPLLYHELLHCEKDESGTPRLRSHDVEEFSEVVRDYGLWKSDVRAFVQQAKS